jgi:hypothetical protein
LAPSGRALFDLDVETFEKHFQITGKNPLVGAASRVNLLNNVGSSLLGLPEYFGENGRPGQLVGTYSLYYACDKLLTPSL